MVTASEQQKGHPRGATLDGAVDDRLAAWDDASMKSGAVERRDLVPLGQRHDLVLASIPKWLLRAFGVQKGSTAVTVAEEYGEKQQVRALKHFQVTLDDGLCRKCNNELFSRLENVVQPVLGPMAVQAKPTTLDLRVQRLLAVWAVKTVYLLELAGRQQYAGARRTEGYKPGTSETGWLLAQFEHRPVQLVEPPPRTMVWLACWDCKSPGTPDQGSMIHYAPSSAPLPTPDDGKMVGQFATLAIGYAVFQVFTVDYVEAEVRQAVVWNPGPPESIADAVLLIWPQRLRAGEVTWPPPAFPNNSCDRLVNWDMALRRGIDP
jgi:hypothetical protein